ncbi:MAG TPA: TylF/MycF/NovP-related O-methyltransferase [Actinocatenispora sp.]
MSGPKRRINALLARTTGYRFVNATNAAATVAMTEQIKRLNEATKRHEAAAARLEKVATSLGGPEPKPAKAAPKGTGFPPDFDEETAEIIRAVKGYTMTGPEKLHGLIAAARYVHRHDIPGDVVECGVWRGGSMQAVARTFDSFGDHSRDLYLFDTFEGMPPPSEKDVRLRDGKAADDLLAVAADDSWVKAAATLEDVKDGMSKVSYPAEKIHYVQGMVEENVPEHAPEQISILRLDTDWYASTKHEFDHLYPRLVSGGVLIIDDYGYWDGSREATEEFLEKSGAKLLLVRCGSGRIGVKP